MLNWPPVNAKTVQKKGKATFPPDDKRGKKLICQSMIKRLMQWLRANESSHDISKYRPRIWKIRITSFGKSYVREWQCTSLVVNSRLMHTFPLSMFTLANTTSGNSMANSYEKMIINSTINKKNSLGVGWGRKDSLPGSHWRLGA